MRPFLTLSAFVCCSLAALSQAPAPVADPGELLARARQAMGFERVGGRVIHQRWISAVEQPYQSDRMYPPFFSMMVTVESWSDPRTAVLRTVSQSMYPGGAGPSATVISDIAATFSLRDNAAAVQIAPDGNRNLDAWLVIADWSKANDVRFAGREMYRDYPRSVLSRKRDDGEQRLLVDEKTGFPVKLEYEDAHYLWGQRKIQYVYSNWQQSGSIYTANTSFRIADDEVEVSRTVGTVEVVAADSALLAMPDVARHAVDKTPMFLRPLPPKTIDVTPGIRILSNLGYNEGIVSVGDEVFVLDATQGEARARQDRDIIRQLYPGAKKINVVVTDLASPHVAGLRYWVAEGATVISHRAAQKFLQQVLDRRWTLNPDSYEKVRRTRKLNFVPVDHVREFANGKIKIFPIDGIGSEVALAVYVVDDKFLWSSDYIQTLSEPSMYAGEVMAAVERENIRPKRVAAEHLPLTEWATVIAAQQVNPKAAGK